LVAAAVLAALVAPGPAAASSSPSWSALRRPLRIPHVAAGAPCRASPIRRASKVAAGLGGYLLGEGPVLATFPPDGVLHYAGSDPLGGWFEDKVLWVVPRGHVGRVLIRGRRVDGVGRVRFGLGPSPAAELKIDPWGYGSAGVQSKPTSTRVAGPGCYGYQVDGPRFSRVIVFRAAP
jgi:hypothetical protein